MRVRRNVVYMDVHRASSLHRHLDNTPFIYNYPKEGTFPYTVVELEKFQLYLPFVVDPPSVQQRVKARLFCVFMSIESYESFVGDLKERHQSLLTNGDQRAADRWYRRQLIHSIVSLAFHALKRISGLEKLFRRIG